MLERERPQFLQFLTFPTGAVSMTTRDGGWANQVDLRGVLDHALSDGAYKDESR